MTEAAVTSNESTITPVEPVSSPSLETPSYEAALSDAYDRAMSGEDRNDAPVNVEATAGRDEKGRFAKQTPAEASPQEGEASGDEAALVSERKVSPAGLPPNWRMDMADVWEAVPEQQREKLGKWSQELHAKMSDMGRKVADVQAIYDDMTASYPERFSGPDAMAPVDAVKFLYQVQKDMDARPVETILEIASRYNAIPDIARALGMGGDQNAQVQTLQNTIQQLEARIADMVSPQAITNHITRAMTEREVVSSVEKFMAEKPFFSEVESVLPKFIEIARENEPEADPLHLLATAYDMAVNAFPAVREKAQAASKAAVQPDLRAAAAKKAASINVRSTANSKAKPRSQEEALGDTYDRLMAS